MTLAASTPAPGAAAQRAWLLLAAGESRQHGGNDGYLDEIDTTYLWDSTVARHAEIGVGDYIAIWDTRQLLGVSIVEDIEVGEEDKQLSKCPSCGKAHLKRRKAQEGRLFRCADCGAEFDEPVAAHKRVITYRSRHDAAWEHLTGALDGPELRRLCHQPKSQHSMRPLDWARFMQALAGSGARPSGRFDVRSSTSPEGHRRATVRVRLGQSRFRDSLTQRFGLVCALTGPAPAAALEAAHLYSYAAEGVHHRHGGLLLRRDVHRLFDEGLLAIHPGTLTVDVSPDLAGYPAYQALHGTVVGVSLTRGQRAWLAIHWSVFREQR